MKLNRLEKILLKGAIAGAGLICIGSLVDNSFFEGAGYGMLCVATLNAALYKAIFSYSSYRNRNSNYKNK